MRSPNIHVLRDPTRLSVRTFWLGPHFCRQRRQTHRHRAEKDTKAVLDAMRQHPLGKQAAAIGRFVKQHPGLLVAKTGIGGTRVVDMQIGEQLPRIC